MEKARANVALSLMFSKRLTDEFLPPDQYEMFLEKPFPEWPKELQDKLRPFGAEMIQ
jgi:hypothetical protein